MCCINTFNSATVHNMKFMFNPYNIIWSSPSIFVYFDDCNFQRTNHIKKNF